MGSFTELTLAFTFAKDTSLEIVGAFAEWRTAEDGVVDGKPAPELPTLDASFADEPFDADDHLGNFFEDDPSDGLTPLQQAALCRYLMAFSDTAYFPATP